MPCLVATNIFNEIHSYMGKKYSLNLNSSSGCHGPRSLPLPCSIGGTFYYYLNLLPPLSPCSVNAHWCQQWQAGRQAALLLLFWVFFPLPHRSPPWYKMPSNGGHCHKINRSFCIRCPLMVDIVIRLPQLAHARNESEHHLRIPRKKNTHIVNSDNCGEHIIQYASHIPSEFLPP